MSRCSLCRLVLLAALLAAFARPMAHAQETAVTLHLWEDGAPGALGSADADVPTLTIYRPDPETANGAAVVVCPGGGYGMLADHEGKPVALWLNTLGVTGCVLKYRLGPRYHHPVMLQDISRALRLVRTRSHDWSLDPQRLGVLGFSAGGHLASTAETHFDSGDPAATDPIDRVSSRPDFAILVYPVITMLAPYTHEGSRENLLGRQPSQELIELLSNERQVTPRTPATFLVHTADDGAVPVENSLMFASALRKAGVPFELHVFQHGPHGFGLAGGDPVLGAWPGLCAHWMRANGFLTEKQPAAR